MVEELLFEHANDDAAGVPVSFRVTRLPLLEQGQAVGVLGSVPELGAWEPTRPFMLTRAAADDWRGSVVIGRPETPWVPGRALSSAGCEFTFKYFVCSAKEGGQIVAWEAGTPRHVSLLKPPPDGVAINDVWRTARRSNRNTPSAAPRSWAATHATAGGNVHRHRDYAGCGGGGSGGDHGGRSGELCRVPDAGEGAGTVQCFDAADETPTPIGASPPTGNSCSVSGGAAASVTDVVHRRQVLAAQRLALEGKLVLPTMRLLGPEREDSAEAALWLDTDPDMDGDNFSVGSFGSVGSLDVFQASSPPVISRHWARHTSLPNVFDAGGGAAAAGEVFGGLRRHPCYQLTTQFKGHGVGDPDGDGGGSRGIAIGGISPFSGLPIMGQAGELGGSGGRGMGQGMGACGLEHAGSVPDLFLRVALGASPSATPLSPLRRSSSFTPGSRQPTR